MQVVTQSVRHTVAAAMAATARKKHQIRRH